MGNDSQSPSSDTLRSRRRSLAKSLSAATSSYNSRFLSAFKPPVTPPAPPPIDLPGLPGIRSDSGVARVFRLDPRVPRQRARRGLFGHDSEEDDNREEGEEEEEEEEEAAAAAARNVVGRGGDTLPKHASVFTGLPSTANSVYPSAAASSVSSSSDVAAAEGGNESCGDGDQQTQRRHHHHGRRKSVTFESDLQRALPPPPPPPPRRSPQPQQPFFLPAPQTPRPPEILSEREGTRMEKGMEVETVTTFKVRVPVAMNLPDDIHVYLPRRGKSARPGLPVEWAVLAVNSGGGGGDRVAGDGERGADSV